MEWMASSPSRLGGWACEFRHGGVDRDVSGDMTRGSERYKDPTLRRQIMPCADFVRGSARRHLLVECVEEVAMRRHRLWGLCGVCMGLAVAFSTAAAGIEVIEDAGFEPRPFNPGDSGLVQRIRLLDNDTDPHSVVLTKVLVENQGTAGGGELDWIRLLLNVGGRQTVLAEGGEFPFMVHLTSPAADRQIPDDELGFLEVSIGTTTEMVDGHTVQPQVTFWYTEGEFGDSALVTATHPAVFATQCFSADLLSEPPVGALNPGDEFTALRIQVVDDVDNNLNSISLTDFRVEGLGMPDVARWILVIGSGGVGSPTVELEAPGQAPLSPDGEFVAPAGGRRVLELRGVVGRDPTDGVGVQPSVALTLQEGPNTRRFNFTSPQRVTIRNAGFETLENRMLVRPGQILERTFQEVRHSALFAEDSDANETPVTLRAIGVTNRGTDLDVSYIEVWDERNVLLGVGNDWGDIELGWPDGRPLRVSDDGEITLNFVLATGGEAPLGSSLLVCKELVVDEIHPALTTPTRFSGRQEVCDSQAVFFGQPEIWLRAVAEEEDSRELVEAQVGSDGETVKRLEGVLRFDHATCVEVAAIEAVNPYRLTQSEVHVDEESGEGELRFVLELTGRTPRPGELLSVIFGWAWAEDEVQAEDEERVRPEERCVEALLMPSEEELEEAGDEELLPLLPVALRLEIVRMVDTADIELPFALREDDVGLRLPAPLPPELDEDVPEEEVADEDIPEEDVPEEDVPDEG